MPIADCQFPIGRRLALVVSLVAVALRLEARVFLTREEALKLAFPGAAIERRTAYLTADQQREAQRLAGSEAPPAALVTYYVASKDGRLVGSAYFDTHVVRTMSETVMVVVDPAGAIGRIEVLSFSEPEEYLPRTRWYRQFDGKRLDDELSLKRGIRPVTGATLTARATTDAARRVLAIHKALQSIAGPTPAPTSPPR